MKIMILVLYCSPVPIHALFMVWFGATVPDGQLPKLGIEVSPIETALT